jgi:hypothetical protein
LFSAKNLLKELEKKIKKQALKSCPVVLFLDNGPVQRQRIAMEY